MGKGLGPRHRAAKLGLFLASVVLALSVPYAAFAANTATFSGLTPAAGSSSTEYRPTLSVIVYDRFGVRGTPNPWSMTLDGERVAVKISRYSGWGWRKFKLSYVLPADLSIGSHKVVVRVTDLNSRSSRKTWDFTVLDGTPPVTTSDAVLNYPSGFATIHLSATDNVEVDTTYYRLDGGAEIEGTVITVPGSATVPMHSLEFWSEDEADNEEAHHTVYFFVPAPVGPGGEFVHAVPDLSCTVAGCHATKDVATIHLEVGCDMCHGTGVDPKVTCNAADCHGNNPPFHTAASHVVIPSVGDPTCTEATCHGAVVVTIHDGDCALCHDSDDPVVMAAIASEDATCETCHTASFATIHNAGAAHLAPASACFNPLCHVSNDVTLIHTTGDDPPGCAACHGPDVEPSLTCSDLSCHPNFNTVHDFAHEDASGSLSSACTACHGTDLPTAHNGVFTGEENLGCFCHIGSPWLRGEMTPLLAAGEAECVDCHKDMYAAHGFNMDASGHNTTTYGTIGALTKFDGSQGPTLIWESEITSASLSATWLVEAGFQPATRPDGITSISEEQTGVVSTDWEFPTVNVFWTVGDPTAPADAMTGLTQSSVITCQDCHTGLNSAGPHGAAQNWGLDPDYPADYSYAELSKQIVENDGVTVKFPSGIKMRSTLTTATQTYTSGLNVICSKCHDLQNYGTGTAQNNPSPLISTGGAPFVHDGDTFTPVLVPGTTPTWRVWTDIDGDPVDGTSAATATAQAWSQTATGTLNTTTIGASNTAHTSHHQDQADGSAQCVNCHVGVPHGWKAPRLLVDTGNYGPSAALGGTGAHVGGDEAPYLDPQHLGTTRITQTTQLGVAPYNFSGFNKIGMLSLSAVDNHLLNAGSTFPGNSSLPAGMVYETGAAYWSEAGCQACNDHAGEDGVRIIGPEGESED